MPERFDPSRKFVVVEGVGCAGKTTQITEALNYLRDCGHPCIETREPGGVEESEAIRNLIFKLKGKGLINADQQIAMFFTARYFWINKRVIPMLDCGISVISDRSFFSTAAYQGFAEGADLGNIKAIAGEVMGNCMPSAVVLIDVSVEVAMERNRKKDGNNDPFDGQKEGYFAEVIDGYRKMAQVHWAGIPWYVVDGEKPIDDVTKNIKLALDDIYGS